MKILLLDADILVYRAGFSVEKRKWYGSSDGLVYEASSKTMLLQLADNFDRMWQESTAEPVENALHNCNTVVNKILGAVKHDKYEAYLSGADNFRKDVATIVPYKANRLDKPKPVHYDALREHLQRRWGAVLIHGMEADDELGIRATEIQQAGDDVVVASIDKDLLTIPAVHYNWIHETLTEIDDEEAYRNFYMQCLTGDRTDNIPGIEDVGPVTARKLLDGYRNPERMEAVVRNTWRQHYPQGFVAWDGTVMDTDNVVDEIKKLLWIRRSRHEGDPVLDRLVKESK